MPEFKRFNGAFGEDDNGRRAGRIGVYTSVIAAEHAAKGKGSWGGKGQVVEVLAVEIDGQWYELASDKPLDIDDAKKNADAKLKEDTLAMLSADQKRVLGIA